MFEHDEQFLEDRIKQRDAEKSDTAFNVRFYYKALENKYQSELQGRPIFDEVEFVEIRNPGDNWSVISRKVNKESVGGNAPDHLRWPEQYRAFKAGEEAPISGTPLTEWQLLPRTRAEELKLRGIKTLEQLASLPEHAARDLIDGVRLRDEASKHLNQSAKQIDMNKLLKRVEILEAENIALRNNLSMALQEKEKPLPNHPMPMPQVPTPNINIEELVNQALTKALGNMNITHPVETTKGKKSKNIREAENANT